MTTSSRVYSRLPADMKPGDVITLKDVPGVWQVETAKLAADLRDSKCVLVRVPDDTEVTR